MRQAIHHHYDQLTTNERNFIDAVFDKGFYELAADLCVPLAGDDRVERAVDALARAVIESREKNSMKDLITDLVATLDALKVKNAASMAKAAHKVLRKHSALEGQNPDIEVFIKPPADRHFGDYAWVACWESGPYQWGVPASMEIVGATGKLAETYYGFDLMFFPGED
jgi:hypothetical protein